MKIAIALAAALALAPAARAEEAKPAPRASTEQSLHAVGLAVAKSLETFTLTPAELETVIKGIRDGVAGKAAITPESQAAVQELVTARRAVMGEREKKKGADFLAKAAKEKGAVQTASGLVYLSLKEGTGAAPAATDKVKVGYTGRLIDGKVFDASAKHGGSATFPLNGVIACWTEGVQRMKVGGKARLVCPAAIAYGDRGAGQDIPPGATLDFEVELLEIVK